MTIALLNKNPRGRGGEENACSRRISIEDHARICVSIPRGTIILVKPSHPSSPPRPFFSTFTFLLHESTDWFRLNLLRQIFLALLLSFSKKKKKDRNTSYREECLYHAILMHDLRLCIAEHVQSSYVQLL